MAAARRVDKIRNRRKWRRRAHIRMLISETRHGQERVQNAPLRLPSLTADPKYWPVRDSPELGDGVGGVIIHRCRRPLLLRKKRWLCYRASPRGVTAPIWQALIRVQRPPLRHLWG